MMRIGRVLISLLLLSMTPELPPMLVEQDLQEVCPVGAGVAVLRGAPWACKVAAIDATRARIEQRMQRMEEHLQRLERKYSIEP